MDWTPGMEPWTLTHVLELKFKILVRTEPGRQLKTLAFVIPYDPMRMLRWAER